VLQARLALAAQGRGEVEGGERPAAELREGGLDQEVGGHEGSVEVDHQGASATGAPALPRLEVVGGRVGDAVRVGVEGRRLQEVRLGH
jgi:hypothetical protein